MKSKPDVIASMWMELFDTTNQSNKGTIVWNHKLLTLTILYKFSAQDSLQNELLPLEQCLL